MPRAPQVRTVTKEVQAFRVSSENAVLLAGRVIRAVRDSREFEDSSEVPDLPARKDCEVRQASTENEASPAAWVLLAVQVPWDRSATKVPLVPPDHRVLQAKSDHPDCQDSKDPSERLEIVVDRVRLDPVDSVDRSVFLDSPALRETWEIPASPDN